jgi:hypothetical protein
MPDMPPMATSATTIPTKTFIDLVSIKKEI